MSIKKIKMLRNLEIKVFLDNENIIYEGNVDNAPNNILNLSYSIIKGMNPIEIYVDTKNNKL